MDHWHANAYHIHNEDSVDYFLGYRDKLQSTDTRQDRGHDKSSDATRDIAAAFS
jgi:hypothetical protein